MTDRLPPLTWLRAFEAAGRLASFRAAAEELNVTPSTISHHVSDLEYFFDLPLFERNARGVRLTREGEACLAQVTSGFTALNDAVDRLRGTPRPSTLRIGAFPFMVNEILVPNLASLRGLLPGVRLSVVSDTRLLALTHADPEQRLHAVVRYGSGRFPGCTAVHLADIDLIPVAAPESAAEWMNATPQDLLRAPRISVTGPFSGWSAWAQGMNVALPEDGELLSFDSYLAALNATAAGLGICMGVRPFVNTWIESRRIVVVSDRTVPAGEASYLVSPRQLRRPPALDVFETWLLDHFRSKG